MAHTDTQTDMAETASNGANTQTDRQTDGHCDSKTELAQWASQADGQCNCTNRQNPPIQQNCRNF